MMGFLGTPTKIITKVHLNSGNDGRTQAVAILAYFHQMRTVHIETQATYVFDIYTLSFMESMLFPLSCKLNVNISKLSFNFE